MSTRRSPTTRRARKADPPATSLPIFTLVDADPYGMDISELYRRSLPSAVSLQLVGISMADVSR